MGWSMHDSADSSCFAVKDLYAADDHAEQILTLSVLWHATYEESSPMCVSFLQCKIKQLRLWKSKKNFCFSTVVIMENLEHLPKLTSFGIMVLKMRRKVHSRQQKSTCGTRHLKFIVVHAIQIKWRCNPHNADIGRRYSVCNVHTSMVVFQTDLI